MVTVATGTAVVDVAAIAVRRSTALRNVVMASLTAPMAASSAAVSVCYHIFMVAGFLLGR